MKSNILELVELEVAREGAFLLPPITQRLRAGEILLVQGRNGAGKSTLLKTIAGLLYPLSGAILLDGQPLAKNPAYPANITYLGHRRGVEASLSVRSHVTFWARAYGCAELIEAALHYFDLEDIADVPVHRLSAGWQQRVALTRLIVQPGGIWLLDEPTANLDEDGLGLLHSIIATRQEQGGIILIASHGRVEGSMVRTLDLDAAYSGEVPHVAHAH